MKKLFYVVLVVLIVLVIGSFVKTSGEPAEAVSDEIMDVVACDCEAECTCDESDELAMKAMKIALAPSREPLVTAMPLLMVLVMRFWPKRSLRKIPKKLAMKTRPLFQNRLLQ